MNNSEKKFDEEALRRKIREQLKNDYSRRQEAKKTEAEPPEITSRREEDESYYLEVFIRRKLQEEVFSKYPEFVKCGNHLDQIKWLTPLEMEKEFEFFPLEYTFWFKLRKKLFGESKVKLPKTPEIQKMVSDFREEMHVEAKERIQAYRKHIKENQKNIHDDVEKRIFEEEQERFYNSQKGYYKYKNHLNETTWMTKDEFESQDEYIERVYTRREKFVRGVISIFTLAVISFTLYYLSGFLTSEQEKGYLIVNIGDQKGNLYINQNLAVGFTPGKPYPVEIGEKNITVLSSGYQTEPRVQKVDIVANDTISLTYKLTAISGNKGIVRLDVPFRDAGIYVDGEFTGTVQESNQLALPEGDHTIVVEKENYFSMPRLHTFALKAGDTLDLRFSMTPKKERDSRESLNASVNLGLISVSANVRGAQIILNGQQTGFQTDYILQKIPLGQHVVRLEKEGYTVYPKEQTVRLSKENRQVKIDFTLTNTTRNVTITVHPSSAKIYVNGNEAGTGEFEGALELGEHKITFSDVSHYNNPGEQLINIVADGPSRFDFKFGSDIYFNATTSGITPQDAQARISEGYILSGTLFKESGSNKPDVVVDEKSGHSLWNIGYAFQYKNPPGMDAVLIRFQAPADLFLLDDKNLKLWLYATDENYPLVLSGKAEYTVILNNTVIAESKKPHFNIGQIAENRYEEMNISSQLKPGFNSLIISAGKNNTRFMQLWKIAIE
ncbi:MAG: PEGA domain-containing protein [Calditrichae bacterium]|nr:PEGA domain-containing protein [Calditrichia bacterium]